MAETRRNHNETIRPRVTNINSTLRAAFGDQAAGWDYTAPNSRKGHKDYTIYFAGKKYLGGLGFTETLHFFGGLTVYADRLAQNANFGADTGDGPLEGFTSWQEAIDFYKGEAKHSDEVVRELKAAFLEVQQERNILRAALANVQRIVGDVPTPSVGC